MRLISWDYTFIGTGYVYVAMMYTTVLAEREIRYISGHDIHIIILVKWLCKMCHLLKQVIEYLQFKNNVASEDTYYYFIYMYSCILRII
jgi:hypothetical protein